MIKMKQELYRYWIGSIPKAGSYKIETMLTYFGSPEAMYHASDKAMEDMKKSCGDRGISITEKDIDIIKFSKDAEVLNRNYGYLMEHGIRMITNLDSSYPEKLRHIYDSPFSLYLKGNPFPCGKKAIAVVGARECSVYGKEAAKYLSGALAKEGILIISGLARGIDSGAHAGALSQGGSTYGIMGCGIDFCYPVENINLYMDMQESGGILSEYGPGIKPLPYHFPMRNRIISGLSDGVLVIEAREKSGSLITVDMGLDQGKNIYAVPGRITDKLSGGCNNLIKMGAKAVTSPQDILEDLLEYRCDKAENQLKLAGLLSPHEQEVYDALTLSPVHIEELAGLTGLDIGKLMEVLLSMELKDLIQQPMKGYYIRRFY